MLLKRWFEIHQRLHIMVIAIAFHGCLEMVFVHRDVWIFGDARGDSHPGVEWFVLNFYRKDGYVRSNVKSKGAVRGCDQRPHGQNHQR